MNTFKRSLLLWVTLLAVIMPLYPDEELWLLNLPPAEPLKAKHNFTVTPAWLNHVQLSSIKLGGASASFISADGLVLTNHHVGSGMIQNLSTKERDLMKTGFYARNKEEELSCPGLEFQVFQEIEDVTARVQATENPELDPAAAAEAREKFIPSLEKDSSEQTGLRSPVVNRKGEVVGVLFDGNIQSLPNNFIYTEEIARSVMVHGQGIIEALLKVYEANSLANEILGKK